MQYGIVLNAGDPATLADLAAEAERAGWDGVFTFDAIAIGDMDLYDPWVVLAAMAVRTERVRLGAILTPPSRRRPWKLAREAMTLDRLSGGRLVLPVGLGTLDDLGFANVGEAVSARDRAERMDEALAILEGLWSGEPFSFEGAHYRFGPMQFRPVPVQRPRIPIWVVGLWPVERSMRRVLRWDGILPQLRGEDGQSGEVTPDTVREIAAYVSERRPADVRDRAFDILCEGMTPADDPAAAAAKVAPWADAGGTWWIEADWQSATVDSLRSRVLAGPPAPRSA